MNNIKMLLTLSVISVLSMLNIVGAKINYVSLFEESYAIVGDDGESKADRDAATPLLIASYAALTPEEAAAKNEEVESLNKGVQDQLAIVNPTNRTGEIPARVAKLKTTYATVLAK